MAHWTEEVFVDRPELLRADLEARVEDADGEVDALLDLLAEEHDLELTVEGRDPGPAAGGNDVERTADERDPELAAGGNDVEQGRALDVACGIGRHAVALAERGIEVTGLDISPSYLGRARELAAAAGGAGETRFVRGDMRRLDALDGRFDLVVNVWTSFGYYDDATNREVLGGMYDRVADGGALVLELVDRDGVTGAGYEASGVYELDDRLVAETREYDPATARMTTERELFEPTDEGYEHLGTMSFDVRSYAPVDLRERLLAAGFADVSLYEDLEGTALTAESTRMVAVARP